MLYAVCVDVFSSLQNLPGNHMVSLAGRIGNVLKIVFLNVQMYYLQKYNL